MNKHFASVFVIVLVLVSSSLVMVKPESASAQTATPTPIVTPSSSPASSSTPTPPAEPTPTPTYPKPSVPQFTAKLIQPQPDTNETRIELAITNQPFDADNPNHYSLVYNVRIKTVADENWTDLYDAEDGYPQQSNTDYTVLSYVLGESAYYPPEDYPLSPSMKVGILPTEGQVEFQVEAMIGYRDRGAYVNGVMPYVFKGERSGWSNTQTINISEPPTQPEPFPTVPVAAAAIAAVVVCSGLMVYFKKRGGGQPV